MTSSVNYPFDEFVCQLLSDAVTAANSVKEARTKAEILSRIAIYYARSDRQERAVEILSQAVDAAKKIKELGMSVKTICQLAAMCQFESGLKEQIEEILTQALQIAQTIRHPEEQNQALAEIAFRYANSAQSDRATQVFELISHPLQKKDAETYFWQRIIREYTDTGQHNRAIQAVLSSEITNAYEKLTALFLLAVDYTEFSQIDLAKLALDRALELSKSLSNSVDKMGELISLAGVYTKIGDREKAVEILSQAQLLLSRVNNTEDLENTNYILAQLAIAFAEAGQPNYASQIAQGIQENLDNLLQIDVLKEVGDAYTKAGEINRAIVELSQAMKVIDALQNSEEKANSLVLIADKYINMCQIERAAELLDRAFNLVENPNKESQENQLKSIMFFYKKAKLYDRALEVARKIDNKDLQNYALSEIALSYTDAGECDRALAIADTIVDNGKSKGEVFTKIALKLAELGDKERSLQLFAKAIEIVKNIRNSSERQAELGIVIRWYLKTRQYDRIQEIVKNIDDAAIEFQTLTWLANGCKQTGNKSKAAELYSLANAAIDRIKDSSEKAQFMAAISYRYAVIGEYDRAVEWVGQIKDAVIKSLALLDIVELYAITVIS